MFENLELFEICCVLGGDKSRWTNEQQINDQSVPEMRACLNNKI